MTIQNIGLFQAMNAKMNYLAQRQTVISQNIANADTPGYQPKDLEKVDFGKFLTKLIKEKNFSVSMVTTDEGHLPPSSNEASMREQAQKRTYEVAPSGNAVILEEQLMKSNDVQLNYNMMVNLYRSNVDMIRTALGKK